MSTVVSEMLVKIGADLTGLRSDMEAAKSAIENGALDMSKAASLAKNALVGLAGAASALGFASMIKSIIDAKGEMYDLSIKTGASVGALEEFKKVGVYTGTSAETIAGSMNKLALGLSKTDEDGKGAAAALRALGIDFNDFKKMKPEEQMLALAGAMDKYEDGTGKSAVAMTLFGRGGADMLPFLKDLGEEAGKITDKLTEQEVALRANQAAMSDAFGDNLTRLSKNSEGWKKELAMGLLPALWEASEALVAMTGNSGGLKDKIGELARDGTLADWARGAMTAISYLLDIAQGLLSIIPMVGKAIAGMAAAGATAFGAIFEAWDKFQNGDFGGAWNSLKNGFEGVKTIGSDTANDISAIWNQKLIGQTFRDSMDSLKGVEAAGKATKPALDFSNESQASADALKKQREELEKLRKATDDFLTSAQSRYELGEKELTLGRDLTEGEKLMAKAIEDTRKGKISLTTAQWAELGALADAIDKTKEEATERQKAKKATEEMEKARVKDYEALVKSNEKLNQDIEDQRAANETLETGRDRTAEVAVQRLRLAAAMADTKAILEADKNLNFELAEEYRKQAEGLRTLADEKEKGIHIKAAQEAAKEWQKTTDSINNGLTDALMRAFENGKGFMEAFRDTLVSAFKTLVLQPTIKAIMEPVSGALGSVFSGKAFAGQGVEGGLGSLMSMGMNFLSGKSMMAGAAGQVTRLGDWLSTSSNNTLSGIGDFISGNSGMIGSGLGMLGNAFSGYGISKALSGGYSAGSWVNGLAGIASAIPGIGPIAGVVGGLVNRAFGMKAKEMKDYGLEGSITGGDATGQRYQDWTQKGGWFRSNKAGTDYSAIGDDLSAALDLGARKVLDQTKAWAEALKLPADSLANVTANFKVKLSDSEQANQAAIELIFTGYQTALTDRFADLIKPFQRAGESVAEAMQRLGALQAFSESINQFGGIFSRVANASIDARENIIKLAGGIDQLMAKAGQFVADYYTEGERAGLLGRGIKQQLQDIGISDAQIAGLSDRASYRALVESLDVSTQIGQKQLVALLELGPKFAQVADYIKSINDERSKSVKEAQDQLMALAKQEKPDKVEAARLSALLNNAAANARDAFGLNDVVKQAPMVDALNELLPKTQNTTDAVVDVGERISQGNAILTQIVDAVKAGNTNIAAGMAAMASAQTAIANAQAEANRIATATNRAVSDMATNTSRAGSAPTYAYDIGANAFQP